jgi:TRAP-type transport system small permease protein
LSGPPPIPSYDPPPIPSSDPPPIPSSHPPPIPSPASGGGLGWGLEGARRCLDIALQLAAAVLLCLVLLCVTLGVVTRAAGDPLIWTDEVARFLMIWLAVLGWLLASRKRVHIRIRFFVDRLPADLRPYVEVILQLAVALFGALTAWYGSDLIRRNLDIEATTVPVSMSFIYLPIVLAGVVTLVQAIGEAGELLRRPHAAVAPADGGPIE